MAVLAAADGHRAASAQERTGVAEPPPTDSAGALLTRNPSFEDRFWLAKRAGWTGDFATAESLFVRLLAERPDDYDSRIGLADVRHWAGRYQAAEADLAALDRTHPNDPEVLARLDRTRTALRRVTSVARWEMGIEYYGEQHSRAVATNGATASIESGGSRWRWRGAATVQQKFDRTEARLGGELGQRLSRSLELSGSAYVAPGAEVLPRQTYGLRLTTKAGPLVLYGDYAFLDFADADVHQVGSRLELYAGSHWLLSGRYAHATTSFTGTETVGNDAVSISAGYLYGGANLLQLSVGAGGESYALPSRDAIGGFSAHTIGVGWRHFVTPLLGLALSYAHQARSDGAKQDSYGVGLVRRW